MMKLFLFFAMVSSLEHARARELLQVNYSLPKAEAKPEPECEVLGPKLDDEIVSDVSKALDAKYWRADKDTIYIIPEGGKPPVSTPADVELFGMNGTDVMHTSRDPFNSNGCAPGHDQGNMANRWCHTLIARTFSSILEKNGVSSGIAALAGGLFWAPKEFFHDLNPSAHDFTFTYVDRLGTKSTTFEVTVFGDAISPKYMGQGFAPFRGSTPFITIRRKL